MRLAPTFCLISAGLWASLATPLPLGSDGVLVRRELTPAMKAQLEELMAMNYNKGPHQRHPSVDTEAEVPMTPLVRHGRNLHDPPQLWDTHLEQTPAGPAHSHTPTHANTPAPVTSPLSQHARETDHLERVDPRLLRYLQHQVLARDAAQSRSTVSLAQYNQDIKRAKRRRNTILGLSGATTATMAGFAGWTFHIARQPAYDQGYQSVDTAGKPASQGQKVQLDQAQGGGAQGGGNPGGQGGGGNGSGGGQGGTGGQGSSAGHTASGGGAGEHGAGNEGHGGLASLQIQGAQDKPPANPNDAHKQ